MPVHRAFRASSAFLSLKTDSRSVVKSTSCPRAIPVSYNEGCRSDWAPSGSALGNSTNAAPSSSEAPQARAGCTAAERRRSWPANSARQVCNRGSFGEPDPASVPLSLLEHTARLRAHAHHYTFSVRRPSCAPSDWHRVQLFGGGWEM
ncbi:hypothetical protein SVAN01_03943 [Stagonosporopsis vannaccii]|nr:hypothetical protein SVAN01_03943 [Stagonosporopsis vannaccii]